MYNGMSRERGNTVNYGKHETLEVTDAHVRLLRRMNVRWNNDAYEGSPEIDLKRPYGNSDVLGDLIEILGENVERDDDGDWQIPDREREELFKWHRQMEDVLQILVQNPLTFETGVWQHEKWSMDWSKA